MIRDVKLLNYLPEFMQEYREMKCLMLAEDPEVQKLEDETEIIKNNQFILTCNEKGLSKYEKLVGILPDPGSGIEERKKRVIEKWGTAVPYSYARFIQRLDQLCWNEGYVIRPHFGQYEIELLVSLAERGQIRDLEWICETYVPANMDVSLLNKIAVHAEEGLYAGGVVSICLNIEVNK